MLDYFKHVSDLIFDNSKSWGRRTSILFSLIFLLLLADFAFNITFNIYTENKLTQLDKITKLKKDYQSNSSRLNEIKKLENEIFRREHYSEFLNRNFINLIKSNKKSGNESYEINDKRSLPLMILSSNTILIIIVFFILILPIFGGQEARQSDFFIGFFSSLLFISFLIGIVTIISYQIPLIKNNPKFNYLTNFIIQIIFYWILYKIFKNKDNTQKIS